MPGSHLFVDDPGGGANDEDIEAWAEGKVHPITGEPLAISHLECPPSSVVVMWTHATHGVAPKPEGSERRWAMITAYRNPGAASGARWMTPQYTTKVTPGLAIQQKAHTQAGRETLAPQV